MTSALPGDAAAHVRSGAGRHDGEVLAVDVDVEAQTLEDRRHVVARDLDAEHVVRCRAPMNSTVGGVGHVAGDVERVTQPLQLRTALAQDLHETRGRAKRAAGDRRRVRIGSSPPCAGRGASNFARWPSDRSRPPRASTSVVTSLISLAAPPMMPASPRTVSSPSTMTQSSPVSPSPRPAVASWRSTPSSVTSVSPRRARRARSVRPATCAAS